MSTISVKYTASSMEDIANSFEAKAKAIVARRSVVATTKAQANIMFAEAEVWKTAAFILRNTTIVPETKEGQS